MPSETPPPILHIMADYEASVRRIADAQGLTYAVSDVDGRAGVKELRFGAMSDAALFALLEDVPDDAYAYQAIVGDPWSD